jgi:hypothetical protein
MAANDPTPEVQVLVVVRRLWGGDYLAFPAAATHHRAYGATEEDVLDQQRRFLERSLGRLSPAETSTS